MSHGVGTFDFMPRLEIYTHAVPFFFVLSGFILMHRYGDGELNVSRFFIARFARLWPCHVVWTALGFLLLGYTLEWQTLPLNLAMLHAWSPYMADFFSYNAVSWSVSTEMALYAAFPFLAKGFRQNWPFKLAICIVIYQACHLIAVRYAPSNDYNVIQYGSFLYAFPPSRIHGFCLGMVGFVMWEAWRKRSPNRPFLAEIAGLAVLLVALEISTSVIIQTYVNWTYTIIVYIGFALAMIPLAQGGGPLARALSWRPLVYLGEISFSIYLSHQILLNVMVAIERDQPDGLWSSMGDVPQFILYLGIVLVCSVATYHLIETPARRSIVKFGANITGGRFKAV
jgi:peptidoglycan/LPS O-acetylase OafA/YrhL